MVKYTISILVIFSSLNFLYAQHEMIADIKTDINTPFGTYHPYLVEITPDAKSYHVEPDLSNVINTSAFSFTSEEKTLLASNYFVVVPRREQNYTGYNEMFDIYNECRELGIPIFVTTDAMLHTFHLCFDFILQTIEQKKFVADLDVLLKQMIIETENQQLMATESVVKSALEKNLNFLYVAEHILDSTYIPANPQQAYFDELALIEEANGWSISPLFEYEEDYSQYKPRGHYTKTDTLQRYFKSMMWLGRMTFAADMNFPNLSKKMTRSAILLIQAMLRTKVGVEEGLHIWERIYDPTVFFVGKSDDINFYQYIEIAKTVYGSNFINLLPDDFANEDLLNQFLTLSFDLPGPKITYPEQPKGFRFMGQRFTPDSWILDELVFNKVPSRIWPMGLDIMAVLGTQRADELLEEMGEKVSYPDYAAKLDSLKKIFKNYTDEVWAQNLYWNWLYSLMPLLFPKGKGFPPFMQNIAWTDKELFASLASWSELRHDTILYVKQSGTERGGMPLSHMIQGYVEPNPYLYARLASLAEFLITGLNSNNLLYPVFEQHLLNLRNLLLSLKSIAEKELTNQPLSVNDYDLICNIGQSIETIVEFAEYGSEGPLRGEEMKMPVIADVHTDANSNMCLEEGVGYPFSIYVICEIEGELVITKGAGFSQYEFKQFITNRLTDEQWLQTLISGQEPPLAFWTKSFLDITAQNINNNPTSFYWQERGLQKVYLTITPDSIKVGQQVTLAISTDPILSGLAIHCNIITPHETQTLPVFVTDEDGRITHIWTPSTPGQYYAVITSGEFKYRLGFGVTFETDIQEQRSASVPTHYSISQNYPNPFNSSTVITYSLPKATFITLTIYNMMGESIRTLVNAEQTTGEYIIPWDGKNNQGKQVSSGVYLYKIIADEFHRMRKMVLLY